MTNQQLIETFFNRSLEKEVNEALLDDYMYVIPMASLTTYIKELIRVPYAEFLYFIISYNYPQITNDDMTQSSSFSAAEIEMCHALIDNDNPGYDFEGIGKLFPQYCKSQTKYALRKYGENQIKTSKQLGLTFSSYGSWYLSCFGYIYLELNDEERNAFIARSILRDSFYGTIIRNLIEKPIIINNYLRPLSDSTINRRCSGILRILKFAINAARAEGIELNEIIRILPSK